MFTNYYRVAYYFKSVPAEACMRHNFHVENLNFTIWF